MIVRAAPEALVPTRQVAPAPSIRLHVQRLVIDKALLGGRPAGALERELGQALARMVTDGAPVLRRDGGARASVRVPAGTGPDEDLVAGLARTLLWALRHA